MQLLNGTRHRLLRADDRQSLPPPPHRRSVTCNCNGSTANNTCDGSNAINRRQLLLGSAAVVGSTAAGLSSSGPATAAGPAFAATSLQFESRVSEFTLPNGLHFIVLERHNAPVVSCHTHARVGAYVEEEGSTGLAHLLEHMAFKGTPRIGSRDWRTEQPLLAAQDEVFYELRQLHSEAEASGRSASRSARMQQLQERLEALKVEAQQLVVPNAFGSMLQEAGAVGLNAATSHDNTRYFMMLPANKLELWFALEAERFQVPVLRELYTEKEVIAEERRARWENSPMGRFTNDYLLQALDNPYSRPVIGFANDFDRFGSHEVASFFNRYYHPANLTISIVGDVDPGKVQQLAERYFGGWAAAPGAVTLDSSIQQLAAEPLPQPAAVAAAAAAADGAAVGAVASIGATAAAAAAAATAQSSSGSAVGSIGAKQLGSSGVVWDRTGSSSAREFRQRTAAGPLLAMGYYRPSVTGRRGTAMEVASDVLTGGRSARLIKQLVLRGSCLSASVLVGYPGDLHPGLSLVTAVPQPGGDMQRLGAELQQQLDALAQDGPTQAELARVKASARAGLLSALTSNGSMSGLLASYHAVTGSWRGVLQELNDVDTLTGPEVGEVVGQVFAEENRFTGLGLPL